MKRIRIISLVACYFTSMSLLVAQDRDIEYMSSGGKLKSLQAIMDIRHYALDLEVDVQEQAIYGSTSIDLVLSQPTDTLLFDLVHLLKVKKILVDNKTRVFFQKEDLINITEARAFKPGRHQIKIEYGGKPPIAVRPPWKGGFTWTKDTQGNPWIVINCQMQGAKIYFPCKDHPSDEPNEGVDMTIAVPKGLVVAGPGLLQSIRNTGDKVTYHWKTNYTISNYCVVFNVAKYKVVSRPYTTINRTKVPMQFYVLEEDTAFAKHVLDLRERDTRILEKFFGEYPWVKEKIGIAEVPNPGMEHQTMITYGDKFKYQRIGGQDYSSNLFHEFGHEWWANKVTNKDWAHMWIQEGIDTYAEALYFGELRGEKGYDSVMFYFKSFIQNKKPIVQGDEVNSVDTYGRDVYFKGAFFMRTLRYVLGDSIFFPTLKKLATDPAYTYNNFVTTDDVERLFSAKSGKNLKPLFDFYLRTTNKLEISISQTAVDEYTVQIANIPMPLPMDILTDKGTQHLLMDAKPLKVKSLVPPAIDAKGYYLKKVMIE